MKSKNYLVISILIMCIGGPVCEYVKQNGSYFASQCLSCVVIASFSIFFYKAFKI